jgi:hypothetical protein
LRVSLAPRTGPAVLINDAETRAEFTEITSIHIYSLEPGPLEV